jgi:hypothetical protein
MWGVLVATRASNMMRFSSGKEENRDVLNENQTALRLRTGTDLSTSARDEYAVKCPIPYCADRDNFQEKIDPRHD